MHQQAEQLAASLPPLLVEAERLAASISLGVHGRRKSGMGETFWQFRNFVPGEAAMISLSAGKRPSSCLEKIFWLSTLTTKMPPLPRTSCEAMPSSFLISAARLEARGR